MSNRGLQYYQQMSPEDIARYLWLVKKLFQGLWKRKLDVTLLYVSLK